MKTRRKISYLTVIVLEGIAMLITLCSNKNSKFIPEICSISKEIMNNKIRMKNKIWFVPHPENYESNSSKINKIGKRKMMKNKKTTL